MTVLQPRNLAAFPDTGEGGCGGNSGLPVDEYVQISKVFSNTKTLMLWLMFSRAAKEI